MTFSNCAYEKEVQQALRTGHWPAGCAPQLRDHVAACANCNDLVLVTEAFQTARNESAHEVPISPSLLWWRAQLMRRRNTTEKVSRPITVAQIFAWVTSGLSTVVFVASQYRHGLRWATWWSEVMPMRVFRISPGDPGNLDWSLVVLIPTLGALVLLGGIVIYLVSEKS
jgi:hypothetical protein